MTVIRDDDAGGYGAVPVTLSRWSLKKVDGAFRAFFRRLKANAKKAGFPRFRGKSRWRSFGFTEFSGIRLKDGSGYADFTTGQSSMGRRSGNLRAA